MSTFAAICLKYSNMGVLLYLLAIASNCSCRFCHFGSVAALTFLQVCLCESLLFLYLTNCCIQIWMVFTNYYKSKAIEPPFGLIIRPVRFI